MRAILIDPEKRTVTEIDIGKGFRETNAVLRCDRAGAMGQKSRRWKDPLSTALPPPQKSVTYASFSTASTALPPPQNGPSTMLPPPPPLRGPLHFPPFHRVYRHGGNGGSWVVGVESPGAAPPKSPCRCLPRGAA
jgi:hypothetical protein